MIPRNRPTRIAAAVGATLAAGAAAMLAATTTASADEPGRCLQNVNIREEPDVESRIVALCEAGTPVELGEERDGFVRIDELGGWAAKDYVKADESSSSSRDGDGGGSSDDDERSSDDEDERSASSGSSEGEPSDDSGDDRSGDDGEAGSGETTTGNEAQLGGLLG